MKLGFVKDGIVKHGFAKCWFVKGGFLKHGLSPILVFVADEICCQ